MAASNWPLWDRIREFTRSNNIYRQERIQLDQPDLLRSLDPESLTSAGAQSAILKQTGLHINRLERYRDYNRMDETGEISMALDLYADEISLKSTEHKHSLIIRAENKRIKDELSYLFHNILLIDRWIRPAARYLCKYGDAPFEIVLNRDRTGVSSLKNINVFNFTRIESIYGDLVGFLYQDEMMRTPNFLHPWACMHARLSSFENQYDPYGISILEGSRKPFKQLVLMEDAALIYRIMRAPERRKFKIPVGLMPPKDIPEYMQAISRMFKRQRFYNVTTGTFDERYSPMVQEDDFFLPVRCLSLDEKIPLLDGTIQTLKELVESKGINGEKFWVYSYDRENKKFVPGLAKCVKGPERQKMVKITLDDGTVHKSTLDHKWFLKDGQTIKAEDLKTGDSLLALGEIVSQITERLVSLIELIDEVEDTYCLEVDDYHNFMLGSGVITHNSDGVGPDIETLPGAENLDQIADIEYFKKKMISPLKVPFDRVGLGQEAGQPNGKSLSQSDASFAKSIEWVQSELSLSLSKVAIVHLSLRGYDVKEINGFELRLAATSAIEELYRMETWQSRVAVMSELKDIGWFPKEWIVTKFTDLSPDEIEELKEVEESETSGGGGLPMPGGIDIDEEGGIDDVGNDASGEVGGAGDIGQADDDLGVVGDDDFEDAEEQLDLAGLDIEVGKLLTENTNMSLKDKKYRSKEILRKIAGDIECKFDYILENGELSGLPKIDSTVKSGDHGIIFESKDDDFAFGGSLDDNSINIILDNIEYLAAQSNNESEVVEDDKVSVEDLPQ